MKKLFVMIAVSAIFVSCNQTPKTEDSACDTTKACCKTDSAMCDTTKCKGDSVSVDTISVTH